MNINNFEKRSKFICAMIEIASVWKRFAKTVVKDFCANRLLELLQL
jgi:hypothetical protein